MEFLLLMACHILLTIHIGHRNWWLVDFQDSSNVYASFLKSKLMGEIVLFTQVLATLYAPNDL